MLQLYTIFHLNIAYSSIEEEQRLDVIRRCYWLLLHLVREYNLPFGIEATAYTLEAIAAIDPAWVEELRWLTCQGHCEFIGSGYAQIIGPLVPAEVNTANLRLENVVYENLLGVRPDIALVNEQAYSAGLVQHYIDAGYRAIAMEWDNPYRCHPEWNPEWRYFPQIACGQHGEEIPLIWNNAIAFQKFQRYAHGEMELGEYKEYLFGHLADQIPLATGVDLIGAAIRIALGEQVPEEDLIPRYQKGVAIRYFFPVPGRVVKIKNEEQFKDTSWVHKLGFFVKPGDIVESVTNHTKRAGFVITTGETRNQAIERALQVVNTIEIETVDDRK